MGWQFFFCDTCVYIVYLIQLSGTRNSHKCSRLLSLGRTCDQAYHPGEELAAVHESCCTSEDPIHRFNDKHKKAFNSTAVAKTQFPSFIWTRTSYITGMRSGGSVVLWSRKITLLVQEMVVLLWSLCFLTNTWVWVQHSQVAELDLHLPVHL